MEIVEVCFGIVVIAAITKRIVVSACGRAAVGIGYTRRAPCVIGVGCELRSGATVYRYHVALQVGFVPVNRPNVLVIGGRMIPHSDRRSVMVIEEENDIVVPLFRNQLTAGIIVVMRNGGRSASYRLFGAQSLVIVNKR